MQNIFGLVFFIIFITASSLFISGCSNEQAAKNEAGEITVTKVNTSCNLRKQFGYCYEYLGERWTDQEAMIDCATSPGGIFSTRPCDKQDTIGKCLFKPGGMDFFELNYYFYKPVDRVFAKRKCPGEFIPIK